MFLPIMEFVAAGLVIWIAITQIVIPILRGTPLFSSLQRQGIEARIESAKHELRIAELERELSEIKRREQAVRLASLEDEFTRFEEDTVERGKNNVVPKRFEQS